jgi:hypothetical protein
LISLVVVAGALAVVGMLVAHILRQRQPPRAGRRRLWSAFSVASTAIFISP